MAEVMFFWPTVFLFKPLSPFPIFPRFVQISTEQLKHRGPQHDAAVASMRIGRSVLPEAMALLSSLFCGYRKMLCLVRMLA